MLCERVLCPRSLVAQHRADKLRYLFRERAGIRPGRSGDIRRVFDEFEWNEHKAVEEDSLSRGLRRMRKLVLLQAWC